jgi:MFS transporter, DHA1 family, solute carrier family 18 (vesicular amine transporter), member 1/2
MGRAEADLPLCAQPFSGILVTRPMGARAMSLKVVPVVGFALFMDYLIYGLIIPLTPYSPAGVLDGAELALLYTAYSIGVLAGTPVFGYLGDRLGYRRPMVWGVVLSALTVVLLAVAPDYPLLLTGRLLQGTAAAATWTAGLSLIAVNYPVKRAEMMGYVLMGSTAGLLLGPTIAGVLFHIGGYLLPFLVTGALVALDAGLRLSLLPRDAGSPEPSEGLRALLLDRSVIVAAAAVALAAIGWGIVEPLLPAHLASLGASPAMIGVIFTTGSIVYGLFAPVVGRVSDRIAIRKVVTGGTIAMACALPLLSLFPGIVGVSIGFCLVSICYAFMLNPTSAELGNAVDRRNLACYGAVYAVYNIAYALGQMAASSFASATASRMSFVAILLCVSAALILFAPLLMLQGGTVQAVSALPNGEPAGGEQNRQPV